MQHSFFFACFKFREGKKIVLLEYENILIYQLSKFLTFLNTFIFFLNEHCIKGSRIAGDFFVFWGDSLKFYKNIYFWFGLKKAHSVCI